MPPEQKLGVSGLEMELSRLFEAVWKASFVVFFHSPQCSVPDLIIL